MCKKLIYLVSFALVLGVTASSANAANCEVSKTSFNLIIPCGLPQGEEQHVSLYGKNII